MSVGLVKKEERAKRCVEDCDRCEDMSLLANGTICFSEQVPDHGMGAEERLAQTIANQNLNHGH